MNSRSRIAAFCLGFLLNEKYPAIIETRTIPKEIDFA